ncbi:MAG: helix-turn-helix transcriptional regulator [Bacteroidota bacterium]
MRNSYHFRIRELREQKHYTQEYIAEMLKVSQRAYSSIESGKIRLTVDRLILLSKIFEVPITEFLVGIPGYDPVNVTLPERLSKTPPDHKKLRQVYLELISTREAELSMLKQSLASLDYE